MTDTEGVLPEGLMKDYFLSDPEGRNREMAVVLAKGEEAMSVLGKLAIDRALGTSRVTAVGGFARATLGYFDREARKYVPIAVDEQAEVLSLLGDIADDEKGRPVVHLHAVLGLRDGSTRGGHLLEGHVWPTLEVIISESPRYLRKKLDPEVGLALLTAK
jgi:predicted DNA-binding protein with PD1-like motif